MSRVLTASPPTSPRSGGVPIPDETAALGPDPTKDYEVQFWLLVEELYELGAEYRSLMERITTDPVTLAAKAKKLAAQLADAELVAKHPQAAKDAAQRLERWQNDLDAIAHIEATARNARGWLAHCWQRMPKRRQKELQKEPAFPGAHMLAQLAGEIWTMAKAGRGVPGKCPFGLIVMATMAMGVMG